MRYLIIVLSALFLIGCGHTQEPVIPEVPVVENQAGLNQSAFGDYTYEGMVDPNTIMSEWIEITRNVIGNDMYGRPSLGEIYYENPNHDELLRYATVVIYIIHNTMAGYSYMLDGVVYIFQYDEATKNYAPYEVGDENQKAWLADYYKHFNIAIAS